MVDYDVGSTGVAQLHISFAKSKDLVTLDSFAYPTADKYDEFEKRFKRLIGDEKSITSTRKNMVIKEISPAMRIGPRVLESRYLGRFCKANGVRIIRYRAEKRSQYEERYKMFSELRSQYGLVPKCGVRRALREIAAQLGIGFSAVNTKRYEFRWRQEHEACRCETN